MQRVEEKLHAAGVMVESVFESISAADRDLARFEEEEEDL